MDIVAATESTILDFENWNYRTGVESLHQMASGILSKNINPKFKDNLITWHRNAVKQLNKNIHTKIYAFQKDTGFVASIEDDTIRKIEEQLGKAERIDTDPRAH